MKELPQISPTDLSQYIRLRFCDRYLWFRLRERATGEDTMAALGTVPQSVSPLLSVSGKQFETKIEAQVARRYRTTRVSTDSDELLNNEGAQIKGQALDEHQHSTTSITEAAQELSPGQTLVLFQVPLSARLWGWHLTGLADLVRLEQRTDGSGYDILVADIKRSGHPVMGYWMQVALYAAMISARPNTVQGDAGSCRIEAGILYRSEEGIGTDQHQAAQRLLGINDETITLSVSKNTEQYLWAARDLLEGTDAPVRRLVDLPMVDALFALGIHCDGCTYQEGCLRLCHEQEDLSLIQLSPVEKKTLWDVGVRSLADLEALMPTDGTTPMLSADVPRLRGRVEELTWRAKAARESRLNNRIRAINTTMELPL